MSYFVASLSFIVGMMLQYGIISRTPLLAGFGDILLLSIIAWGLHQQTKYFWIVVLVISALLAGISAEPFLLTLGIYMLIFLASTWVRKRIIQSPLLAMFFLTFIGTLMQHGMYIANLFVNRVSFSIQEALWLILLPSLVLNMFLAIPVHALVQELARSTQPRGLEA